MGTPGRGHGASQKIQIWKWAGLAALVGVTIPLLRGCGSAATDQAGRCKAVSASNYVAASTDTDGKPWTYDLTPTEVSLKCYDANASGTLVFTGVIKDSQSQAKAGLTTNAFVSQGAGLTLVTDATTFPQNAPTCNPSDAVTDACGVAIFCVQWQCPGVGKQNAGVFYAFSGPLSSKQVNIVIEHPAPTPVPTATGLVP